MCRCVSVSACVSVSVSVSVSVCVLVSLCDSDGVTNSLSRMSVCQYVYVREWDV